MIKPLWACVNTRRTVYQTVLELEKCREEKEKLEAKIKQLVSKNRGNAKELRGTIRKQKLTIGELHASLGEVASQNAQKKTVGNQSKNQSSSSASRKVTTERFVPKCHICMFDYSSRPGNVPRLLECGHTVCEGCAGQIAFHSIRPTDQWYSVSLQKIITCPFDRREMHLKDGRVNSLPKNFFVMEMLEEIGK